MKNRRDFIRISAAGSLGAVLLGHAAFSANSNNDKKGFGVGLQLYSIRDAMAKDLAGALQKVSDYGYKYLEMASYADGSFYGKKPKEFKKMVNDLGMKILSSHTQVEATGVTIDNARKMAEDHADAGVAYCVQPWVNIEDRKVETYKQMVGDWNKVGEIMKGVGIQFGYHNHNFEFQNLDGVIPYYDIFMKELDSDLVTMEFDIYWAIKAGQDPVEVFKKYPGRFQLWHLKDMTKQNGPYFDLTRDDITSVGSGLIDYKRIFAAAKAAGMKYFIVEDDNQGNGKPFEGIKTSINNIIINDLH